MAGCVDQEILGLKVAVDVAKLVESVYTAKHLGNVEARMAIV